MDWITSDSHFGHANVIKYCKRPFSQDDILDVDEMDKCLMENINCRVGENDRLFHLGDFARRNVEFYKKQIRCKNVFLIRGNHDKMKSWEENLFSDVADLKTIKVDIQGEEREIVLCHYAMRVWNKSHHGACHAWGHSHASLPDDPNARSMDVGVDNIAKLLSPDGIIRRPEDYRPISLVEFFDFMNKKTWKPIDHHGRDSNKVDTW